MDTIDNGYDRQLLKLKLSKNKIFQQGIYTFQN